MANLKTPKVKQTAGAKTDGPSVSGVPSFTSGGSGINQTTMKARGRNMAKALNQNSGFNPRGGHKL